MDKHYLAGAVRHKIDPACQAYLVYGLIVPPVILRKNYGDHRVHMRGGWEKQRYSVLLLCPLWLIFFIIFTVFNGSNASGENSVPPRAPSIVKL
jgi:hypothetical protein